MIVLFNPRATNPRNRRFPLSIMSLAAVLEGHEQYVIVDGNVQNDAVERILRLIENGDVELIGVTVMPGPQMASAVEACKTIRRAHPKVPIVWGGITPFADRVRTQYLSCLRLYAASNHSTRLRDCRTKTSLGSIAITANGR